MRGDESTILSLSASAFANILPRTEQIDNLLVCPPSQESEDDMQIEEISSILPYIPWFPARYVKECLMRLKISKSNSTFLNH